MPTTSSLEATARTVTVPGVRAVRRPFWSMVAEPVPLSTLQVTDLSAVLPGMNLGIICRVAPASTSFANSQSPVTTMASASAVGARMVTVVSSKTAESSAEVARTATRPGVRPTRIPFSSMEAVPVERASSMLHRISLVALEGSTDAVSSSSRPASISAR